MKKIFFISIILMIFMLFVACNNNSNANDSTTTDVSQIEVVEKTSEIRTESDTDIFIQKALQYIDEYPNQSKKLENLSAEIIQKSCGFKDMLYDYLNHFIADRCVDLCDQYLDVYGNEEVHTVKVWIHNYKLGGCIGCVKVNNHDILYNYEHEPLFLSAGVLGKKYPDNITLAEARIASYVLLHMNASDVDCCIRKSSDEKYYYDFTFQNNSFKEMAKEILLNLSKE